MTKGNQIRIPLKTTVTERDLDRHSLKADWDVTALLDYDEETDQPYEIVWATWDKETTIHYIVDHGINVRYLLIEGAEREKIGQELRAKFDLYDRAELLANVRASREPDEIVRASRLLAVGAPPEPDIEIVKVFDGLLAHPDTEVRRATLFTITYLGWPNFKPIVERLAAEDDNPAVRSRAAILLEGYELQEKGLLSDY